MKNNTSTVDFITLEDELNETMWKTPRPPKLVFWKPNCGNLSFWFLNFAVCSVWF